jgi:methanogenic corrinoid protein MtbC1
MTDSQDQLVQLLANLEEDAVLELVRQRLASGEDPLNLITACNEGMQYVGKRYEEGQYFISGLIMSGEIFREVMEIIQPHLVGLPEPVSLGKVLIGTVAGDIHDIGKNITSLLLSCYGFTVVDLGTNVPEAEFAKKAVEVHPDIVGLSGLLSVSIERMKTTVTVLRMISVVHDFKFPIVIGGAIMNESACRYVGADYWVTDAMTGIALFKRLMSEKK